MKRSTLLVASVLVLAIVAASAPVAAAESKEALLRRVSGAFFAAGVQAVREAPAARDNFRDHVDAAMAEASAVFEQFKAMEDARAVPVENDDVLLEEASVNDEQRLEELRQEEADARARAARDHAKLQELQAKASHVADNLDSNDDTEPAPAAEESDSEAASSMRFRAKMQGIGDALGSLREKGTNLMNKVNGVSAPGLAQRYEDCMACRLVWKQVELDVGNARYIEDVQASFEHNCLDAQKSQIFFKACEDMYDDMYAFTDDYMSGTYSVDAMCQRGKLCQAGKDSAVRAAEKQAAKSG